MFYTVTVQCDDHTGNRVASMYRCLTANTDYTMVKAQQLAEHICRDHTGTPVPVEIFDNNLAAALTLYDAIQNAQFAGNILANETQHFFHVHGDKLSD